LPNHDEPKVATDERQTPDRATKDLDSIKTAEWWLIGIQVTVLITSIAICVIYSRQLAVMRGQLTIMQAQLEEIKAGSADTHELAVQAKNQADASKAQSQQSQAQTTIMNLSLAKTGGLIRATDALGRQAQISSNIALSAVLLEQRPWITSTRWRLSSEPEEGKDFNIISWIENSGKTPAIDLRAQNYIMLWHGTPPLDDQSLASFRHDKLPGNSTLLAPQDRTVHFLRHWQLNKEQVVKYVSGEFSLYYVLHLKYLDIFGNKHWTTLCIYHEYGMDLAEFTYCEHGNDADGIDINSAHP
jgi:hypothetical protein